MSKYPFIQTIRYMGNKGKLLDYIIPEIEKLTKPGDVICDIMAGTNVIGYALKNRNIIIANDIQFYSYIISKCMLGNFTIPSTEKAHCDLDFNIEDNKINKHFYFFVENYTDTYFAGHQCLDIDSFRYAIEKVADENLRCFYLTILMSVMCKAQSTPGHFAQYMDKYHTRIIPLQQLSIYELFYSKLKDFNSYVPAVYENLSLNMDYKNMLNSGLVDNVDCFYLDSPYTSDQYSRFYHVLETICRYDNPKLEYKAKYRTDRIKSEFCYKKNAKEEFENIIKFCASKKSSLVISYSNHGVLAIEEIEKIAKIYYDNVVVKYIDYEHSSQGKGTIDIKEVIFILK